MVLCYMTILAGHIPAIETHVHVYLAGGFHQ